MVFTLHHAILQQLESYGAMVVLKDLLVDSSVYAAGTVDQMLNGKELNRAVRALMLAYEAMSVSWLDTFFSWCVENDLMKSFPERFWSCLSGSGF